MSVYDNLDKYIDYFSDTNKEFCYLESGYPRYDDEVYKFIDEVYKSDLLKHDYMIYLENLEDSQTLFDIIQTEEIKEYVDTVDYDAYFGHIRTLIPTTCGQHFGIIRTA